ncbi:leucyl aminopeptidase family protein [Afifella pfennigii]|uniref:leucyl aminopeptidase family protein n=1 Tax=Afifella pfennigii TaxID=209897 RepID=UPI00047AB219|nr:leucyl aminopeptidase family protein [Afifella pfennigii]
MISGLKKRRSKAARSIHAVRAAEYGPWLEAQEPVWRRWLADHDFAAKPGAWQTLPSENGAIESVLLCLGDEDDLWAWADLAASLPAHDYAVATKLDDAAATTAAIGWALGTYRFDGFRAQKKEAASAQLVLPTGADLDFMTAAAEAEFLGRDLINRPANDLGPTELATAARNLARRHKAECKVIVGDALLKANFPAVHTVGAGSPRTPALVDIRWGRPRDPKVTLVGKGVTFDTGGLTVKTEAWMRNMKKDMGGAATVLALAHLIMATGLRVRLRVLIPTVENSTSGSAYRPGDIVPTRKGLGIEVANCDAEGRVILADALTAAAEEKPELLIDVATLTGAARAALGPEIAAFFSSSDSLARELDEASHKSQDPLWRLPLWAGYRRRIESTVGDILNLAPNDTAGAITAALFLQEFVEGAEGWLHLDIFGWNDTARPGRPVGGEAAGLRALYRLLATRYPAA